ncbi:MAG: tetratricopeptide repeat protein [Lamprocystis purpurea]|uniref:cytochrome c3 family protein n=1 Tax=Lamprocystis purpurea TaxID=61598 RepID=UPI00037C2EA8|nr:cytochrome c3 family protein [Lamprocystis purpurea]MBV5275745.1 tetratricopeptide repeat protein [Lamprocystis purpurea]
MFLHTLLPLLLLIPIASSPRAAADAAGYLGVQVCGECHVKERDLWRDSYHDRAMKEPTAQTVLGDFNDVEFTAHGVTSRFFKRDGRYFVHTDGPDGTLTDYPIRYTFGWYPLQQYLIEFPGGRLQALGIAWDSRPTERGGQRWFHLYPNEKMDHTNPLHWTGLDQTWNYQCADCHSTDLKKGYDAQRNVYDTRFVEINVACEACHGPGARHVEWARAAADAKAAGSAPPASDPALGLAVDLKDRDGGQWQIDPATGKPMRSVPRTTHTQTETCARCHSRRGRIWEEVRPGEALNQGFRLALLEPNLYFPDGQIKDEVFDFGSFIQSRMYHQGVVCSDCHEPHSLKPMAAGNALCLRCHQADRYDVAAHHHHAENSTGTACIACHMTQRFYMVVDERADHSLRVPRPDLSAQLGTPNACNGCHQDKDAAWAAAAVAGWFPDPVNRKPHFGEALHAADTGAPDAASRLLALAGDPNQPGIARATALERLHDRPSQDALLTVRRLLADPDALVRAAAVRFLDLTDLRTRVELAWPLLSDPVRTVRLEAARVLAPLMTQKMGDALVGELTTALEEYVAAETVNADRPESNLNLGSIAAAAGEPEVAQRAYQAALRLDPRFVPAYANLADLYRAQGQESQAQAQLRAGLAVSPDSADLNHALGLALVRAKRLDAALESLRRASDLAPNNTHYAYVYAVALDGAERTAESLPVLEAAAARDGADSDLLIALVQYNAKLGRPQAAAAWLDKLAILTPADPAVEQLRKSLGQSSGVGLP